VMTLVSLVVPTYNEHDNIIPLLDAVRAAMAGRALEIWVIDDDSPDGTWRIAGEYARAHPEITVVRRRNERGLSGAVIEGFRQARGEILAVMDADLSHDPALLPSLVDAVLASADVSVGSRRVPGGGADRWPWYRHLASHGATGLARWALGVPLADPMSGYFVVRRDVFESVRDRLRARGYKILLEIVARTDPLKIVELPYVFRARRQGVSKMSVRVAAQYLTSLWMLRRDARARRRARGIRG
jgi:dolichol-phosphate mannosyltransferase